MQEITPDPLDPEFGLDPFGALYRKALLRDGELLIDMGYIPIEHARWG